MNGSQQKLTASIIKDWEPASPLADYYSQAERVLHHFWGDSVLAALFAMLDHSDTLELACGRGRHVDQYRHLCRTVTLVDPVAENIAFCRERFARADNVECVVNCGDKYDGVADESKTAVFCYDAMVHFEVLDVASYLYDTFRILKPGGKALFHHSNYTSNPGAPYNGSPHSRNFMSAGLFAHLAMRAGLTVVAQSLLTWGRPGYLDGVPYVDLDCITLCRKELPATGQPRTEPA